MDGVARLRGEERREIFEEGASRTGWTPTVVEKDFWVCWTLKRLFGLEHVPPLIFKGGTSLSKGYGVIRRFSEDIDLAFDRAGLGFAGDNDPGAQQSKKKRQRKLDELHKVTRDFIQGEFADRLRNVIAESLGLSEGDGWYLELDPGDDDGQTLLLHYPRKPTGTTLIGTAGSYIRPQVKVELGSRSEREPAERRKVLPYAAKELPEIFADPSTEVEVLAIERTFWEKATILHQEAHRIGRPRKHHARHYYDFVMVAHSGYRDRCYERVDLLTEVADHKDRFFPQSWARYDLARDPATLKLVPGEALRRALASDYDEMRRMMFADDAPAFDRLIEQLSEIEAEIRALGVAAGGE